MNANVHAPHRQCRASSNCVESCRTSEPGPGIDTGATCSWLGRAGGVGSEGRDTGIGGGSDRRACRAAISLRSSTSDVSSDSINWVHIMAVQAQGCVGRHDHAIASEVEQRNNGAHPLLFIRAGGDGGQLMVYSKQVKGEGGHGGVVAADKQDARAQAERRQGHHHPTKRGTDRRHAQVQRRRLSQRHGERGIELCMNMLWTHTVGHGGDTRRGCHASDASPGWNGDGTRKTVNCCKRGSQRAASSLCEPGR